MTLKDNRIEIEKTLDSLFEKINIAVLSFEQQLDTNSICRQTIEDNQVNAVSYLLLHAAFASICELRSNLKTKNFISAMLITRHLMELHSDFKLIFSNTEYSNQFANAYWYFGVMRNLELNKTITVDEKEKAKVKWKKYKMLNKNNKYHWSGLDRTEVIKLAWSDDSIYRVLSAIGHSSLLTQDLVWWSYSERAIGYTSANVDAVIGMV